MINQYSETVRPEVSELMPIYKRIRDVIENRVTECGEIYLPCPSGKPLSKREEVEKERYDAYKRRAVFYNFLARTLTGFIGQIYSRDAEVTVPATLEALEKDANGDGLTLEQLSKEACAEVLSVGRFGLLVDYPNFETNPTKQQIDDGIARPVIVAYKTENIIDWDYSERGAKKILSYLVLRETYSDRDKDTGGLQIKIQWRVLSLENDVYTVSIWREDDGNGNGKRVYTPKADNKTLDEIPFTFIGAVNNDARVDRPPMQDMADINIGHYRNSADYEESVFLIGQPTLVVTGLTEKWWNNVLKGILRFGSRNGIQLEKDSDAKILQAEPNTLAKEAMDSKKEQLAAMGAEFLREQSVQKTATEADINDAARTSAIANAARNVTDAFKFALEWAAVFQGESETTVDFKLNSEFDLARMTEGERSQLMKEWQAGAISWTEYRSAMRKAGIATEKDEAVKAEREEMEAAQIERMAAEFEVTQPAAVGAQQ